MVATVRSLDHTDLRSSLPVTSVTRVPSFTRAFRGSLIVMGRKLKRESKNHAFPPVLRLKSSLCGLNIRFLSTRIFCSKHSTLSDCSESYLDFQAQHLALHSVGTFLSVSKPGARKAPGVRLLGRRSFVVRQSFAIYA